MDDGSCIAFFEAPDMPFDFKTQHDYDLHIALEVTPDDLQAMLAKGRAAGVETRGVSDHRIIHSIYFRDPNGYVVELTAKAPGHDEVLGGAGDVAQRALAAWQARKSEQPATVA